MIEKKYNTIQDLLEDQSFNNWALNPNTSDASEWELWIKKDAMNETLAAEAKDIIVGINFKNETVSEEKINSEWDILSEKLQSIQNKQLKNKVKSKSRLTSIRYISIAASFLLLVSLSVFSYSLFSEVSHKTGYGEMLNVVLEDGSVVTLNANSSIRYTNYNPRSIKLTGEAFFKVEKGIRTKSKFTVNTDNLTVEVYGTQFNVKTSKKSTNVYLEEGSILLNLDNGKEKKMIPGGYIEYSAAKQKIVVNKNNKQTTEYTSWKNGNLIFNNTNLEEALSRISETYGVQFSFNKEVSKDILITGKVPTTNLDICLNAIKKSTNINIQKENGILVVYKN